MLLGGVPQGNRLAHIGGVYIYTARGSNSIVRLHGHMHVLSTQGMVSMPWGPHKNDIACQRGVCKQHTLLA